MTCNSCGFVHTEDFSYCPNCGAPAPVSISPENVSAQPVNTAAEKILKALRDPLFLVLSILMKKHLMSESPIAEPGSAL